MSEWRTDIEEAKTGNRVILFRPTCDGEPPEVGEGRFEYGEWFWTSDGEGLYGFEVDPTHWMPLPPAP